MLNKLKIEIDHFKSQPHNFRILIFTNLVYAFVLPVIDTFVAAYVMRNSNEILPKWSFISSPFIPAYRLLFC